MQVVGNTKMHLELQSIPEGIELLFYKQLCKKVNTK